MKYFISGLIFILTFAVVILPQEREKKNFILLVVPENDTTKTTIPNYRLSGSTLPYSQLSMNGKPLKLYNSGAFADLLNVVPGVNNFELKSISPSGEVISKNFVIIRNEITYNSTPVDTLIIEDNFMLPGRDMWLDLDDVLEVRIKGTPECKADFLNGVPMYEQPESVTGGIRGIYTGTYRVSDDDNIVNEVIKFRLINSSGEKVEKISTAKISFLPKSFPRVGITKGDRPALNYGLGTNRLGGAKLNFINPGIKLKINGKIGSQYRILLSENQEAWISENEIDLLSEGHTLPFSLTGSWNVYGDEKYDYVKIGLEEKLPYSTFQEIDPSNIIVDIYGAVSNTNWITQHLSAKEIKNVYYNQIEKDVFRITIELTHKQIWGYSIDYEGNSFVIKIKKQPRVLEIENLIFALDAGHGGTNLGALGSTGIFEKDINLSVINHLKELLEDYVAKVILTRNSNTLIFNSRRLKSVLEQNADILISVHANSIGYGTHPEKVKGTSTYYKHICYRPLSQFIYDEMLNLGLNAFGNVGSFNFTLNSPTELPNVLVETAFMSNPEDEMKLLDDDFRFLIAEKIVEGVERFLEYCESEE